MKSLLQPEGFTAVYLKPVEVSISAREGLEWIGVWKLKLSGL
jgi:hypothetical protein